MLSPLASALVFVETQWFYRRWWWLMLGATALTLVPLLFALNKPQGLKAAAVAGPLVLLVVAGLWLIRLHVRVDEMGIHYQFTPFLNRWRHWPWNDFRQVQPRTYSPLGDYGGWGIKGWPGNLAYNVWGEAGLQLVFQSGNRLLLGTQQPEELRLVLVALHQADPTLPITL
jgi:hypothetical protein